jgi:Zn-dependent protease
MSHSWKLGSLCGIGVYVHWTFLFLPIYVVLMTMGRGMPVALFAVTAVLLVFPCVLLHELGHALMARRFGIATRDIMLYPIGGVARLERMSEKPWEEFWIAIAGPAVNVGIVALLSGYFRLGEVEISNERLVAILALTPHLFDYPLAGQFLLTLFLANQALVIFNMVPAFPMDGGRVLRAVLGMFLDHLHATEVAVALGGALAWLFALAGLGFLQPLGFGPNGLLVLVAVFVFLAGQQELAVLRYRIASAAAVIGRPSEWHYVLGPHTRPPAPDFTGYTWDERARIWIEWRAGVPVRGCFLQ